MTRHIDPPREAPDREPGAQVAAPAEHPNLSGDIETLLGEPPAFRLRLLGYDRLQVDNYVAWAESELQSARRETDDLVDRYGRCWAELELARQVLARSPEGQRLAQVSERIGSMLQLAADEAAEITATAERLRREAAADRAGAAAVRQQADGDVAALKKRAEEECERLDAEAARTRARLDVEAAQVRERLDREAAERRDRATAQAAERIRQQAEAAQQEREAADLAARQHLARLEAEVTELERRREIARNSLVRMSDQVSEAVTALAESLPPPGLRVAPPQQAAS
jgi:chromosome segregation ATPase